MLCDRLIQKAGVAILTGTVFGRNSNELTARLSYVDFDGARALAASEQIPPKKKLDEQFLIHYCGHTLDAINDLITWIQT